MKQLSIFDAIEQSEEDVISLINRRRRQILVHSCLYYRLDENIIGDYTYDKWAKELANLHKNNLHLLDKCIYNQYFGDFGLDGNCSGYALPHHLPEIVNKALQLLENHNIKKKRGLL